MRAASGLLDLRGVVHVHTNGSHDSPGTIEAVLSGARAAGLAWVALTEHTKPGRLPRHGVIEGITVLPGFEVRSAGASMLALGVNERPPKLRDPAELVRWIHGQGGVAFVGHFEKSRLADPAAYRRAAPDGVEIINLHAMALAHPVSLAFRLSFFPASLALRTLLRTPEQNLERWAALPEARAIVSGVDAHAKFRVLGRFGGTLDRYRDIFRMVTTHVLAEDAQPESILGALRAGRSYVALEGLGRVERFRFEPHLGRYEIAAPRVARLVLVCDGAEVDSAKADTATFTPPDGARQCRAEAWLGNRLWIVTSYQESPAGAGAS